MSHLSDLQNKKLGLFELVAMGFDLYLTKKRIFLSVFFGYLLFFLPFISLSIYSQHNFYFYSIWLLYQLFIIFVIHPLFIAIVSSLTESYIFQENIQFKALVERIASRIISLIGLWSRFKIKSLLLSLLLIVPGIIYGINNGFFLQALVLRDQKGKAAFQYSQYLVKGNWWKVFSFSLLISIFSFHLFNLWQKNFVDISSFVTRYPILNAIFAILIRLIAWEIRIDISVINLTSTSIILDVLIILIGFGLRISQVLLFLNLEFQKK